MSTMAKQECCCLNIFSFLVLINNLWCNCMTTMGKETIPIGVVLDLNSRVGEMAESCISMAVSDFYATHDDYRTRISLITRDSKYDVVTAAAAAVDLIKNEEVVAIIGPQKSSQAKFLIELGEKSQVPIISFSATSPSLSPTQNQYFFRTALDDSFQVKAIASIVQNYGWREIVPLCEDTEFGNGLVPYLLDAFQEIGTRVPYNRSILWSASDAEITSVLNKMKAMKKRVYLVHMSAPLGSRLFLLAKAAGMMSDGYAWLVTTGLSTLLDPVDSEVMDSMLGVLGVRPCIPKSKQLTIFESKWKKNLKYRTPNSQFLHELNLFGLWAYDTISAIAMAVEKSGTVHSSFLKPNASAKTVDLAALGTSETGPRLLHSILNTRFRGLSGDIHLVKGEMASSAFEVFNVIRKSERIIGYWTPEMGLSRELDHSGRIQTSSSKDKLKSPIWPGDTVEQPNKLRIGVPVGGGFEEIIKVEWHPGSNEPIVSGFCSDVFRAAVDALPFPLPHEFVPFVNKSRESAGDYNALIYEIKLQHFDGVVGDTTIVANRSKYVDFTLPYTESGVTMVVLMKPDERDNMWIFLKPLSLKLWLTTGAAFIFTGLVVWVLEHRTNTEFRGPPEQQLGTIFWFSFSTLVFSHREKLANNLTRFLMIIWIFVVLILSQSYTASLASMLTVQRMQPSFVDVKEIIKNNYSVGYQKGSFVKEMLIKEFNFTEKMLKDYSNVEQYHDALSSGSHNGGVAAIFDEIPFINLLLAKYCSKFQMVGPTYKTDGFGFAFPLGSPLVSHMSRAILNVTQDTKKMEAIKRKNFGVGGDQLTCDKDVGSTTSPDGLRLSSFGGLFIITGVASTFSLLIYILTFLCSNWPASNAPSFWLRILELTKQFDQKDDSAYHFRRSESRVHPVATPESAGPSSPDIDDEHALNSNEGAEDAVRGQDRDHFTSEIVSVNVDDPDVIVEAHHST